MDHVFVSLSDRGMCCQWSLPQGPLSFLPLTETEHSGNLSILKFESLMCCISDFSCEAPSNLYGTLCQTEGNVKRQAKKLDQ